ncbi:unnamed protein product [Caenorhabditis angaria]|uniref:Uncharacterized protein n=1 Tax=Caenorhabditis angaria TaxID=860376 RepID=A0A9P1I8J1_9PELO|nr:unnamed protein product [Caenorhabditis angaria]
MDVISQSGKCWGKWNMAENGTTIFEKLGFQEDECSPTNLTLFITPFNSSENLQSLMAIEWLGQQVNFTTNAMTAVKL